jgi:hypothetical protein
MGVTIVIVNRHGAAALCDIREAGGITIAQKLEAAAPPDIARRRYIVRLHRLSFHPKISYGRSGELRAKTSAQAKRELTPS